MTFLLPPRDRPVHPTREALIERLAAESRAKQQDRRARDVRGADPGANDERSGWMTTDDERSSVERREVEGSFEMLPGDKS